MPAGTALRKINARVKQLAKRFPKKKRVSLQKQAGAEYRAGKLKPKRKPSPVKRKVRRKTVAAKKRTPAKRRAAPKRAARRRVSGLKAGAGVKVTGVTRRRKRRAPKKVAVRRRRVSGGGSKMNMLVIGGLALGAIYLMSQNKPSTVYVPTGNTARDTKAQQILSLVAQAGASAAQVAAAIAALNKKSDAQIDQYYQQAQSGAPVNIV